MPPVGAAAVPAAAAKALREQLGAAAEEARTLRAQLEALGRDRGAGRRPLFM